MECYLSKLMRYLPQTLSILCAALLGGCASEVYAPEAAPEQAIIQDFAPFYRTGPVQARGPDSTLRAGDRVKLLRKEMGYSYVMLEDERTGYIANEFMAPAPPRPQSTPAPSSGSTRAASSSRSGSAQSYRGPQVNDSPLPEPLPMPSLDLNIGPEDVVPFPSPSPTTPSEPPKFRY